MPHNQLILVAEDDENYVVLIREAFAEAGIQNPIHVVWNGEEVIYYLQGKGKYADRAEFPLPGLLLLDLKMPRVNGFEALTWIRKQPSLSGLRVLVLTSSDEIRDVNKAYQLGANSFLVKPYDFEDLAELSRLIQDFWLKASKAPEAFRPPRDKESGSNPPKIENGTNH
jgi:CheY-like chemotaxis protein